jgi:hypothetical protein
MIFSILTLVYRFVGTCVLHLVCQPDSWSLLEMNFSLCSSCSPDSSGKLMLIESCFSCLAERHVEAPELRKELEVNSL